jgi:hypothetical protein
MEKDLNPFHNSHLYIEIFHYQHMHLVTKIPALFVQKQTRINLKMKYMV